MANFVKGGMNLIKSNQFTGKVLKTAKELLTVDGGINGVVKNVTKKQAKELLDSTGKIAEQYGNEVAQGAEYLAMSLNDITGKKYRGEYIKKAKASVKSSVGPKKATARKVSKVRADGTRVGYSTSNVGGKSFVPKGTISDKVGTKGRPSKGSAYRDYVSTLDGGFKGNLQAAGYTAQEYFWSGATKGQRAARIGAAAAGYVGVNAVGRAITGGDMRHNSRGEDDIAGIPFI